MENYNINKHIRKVCKKNIIIPGAFLIIIVIFILATPFFKTIIPTNVSSPSEIENLYENGVRYIDFSFEEPCYFVGEYVIDDKIEGYYYFTMMDNKATFFIISEENLKNRPDVLEFYQGKAKLTTTSILDEKMFSDYAEILGWTPENLKESSSKIFINELEYDRSFLVSIMVILIIVSACSLYFVLSNIIYIRFPNLYPACVKLKRFGSKPMQLKALNYELENSIVMIKDKIVITRSYLVEFSNVELVIIPLVKITRVYEHTKWHKILWIKTNLSYTLNVVISKFFVVSLKGNNKEAVETILEYLQSNYLDTKVGYSDSAKN